MANRSLALGRRLAPIRRRHGSAGPVAPRVAHVIRVWSRMTTQRRYTDKSLSQVRHALDMLSNTLVGVGQLAARLPDAYFPLPKPFGFHMMKRPVTEEECIPDFFKLCVRDTRSESLRPDDSLEAHCDYAVNFEFPWFPFFVAVASAEPPVKDTLAQSILRSVRSDDPLMRGRRWWFAYELFFERLPLPDVKDASALMPFLPPERFFTIRGTTSARHGVVDNLLGGKDFCPFVEKFAGAADASEKFKSELLDVLSPICMMTVKEFLKEVEITHGSHVDHEKVDRLARQLAEANFAMSLVDQAELRGVFGLDSSSVAEDSMLLSAARLVDFAQWLRGESKLASRLREHLLGATPIDLRWHAPGEIFLDRLSRVISAIETRASQMIEGDLPPERKERFFVDAISKPWNREDVVIDARLVYELQQGLLSADRFSQVCQTQVPGEPRRLTQNWISSERHDDMVGKEKVLHYLPPPPEALTTLYDGYFECVRRMLGDPTLDPIVCATVAKIAFNTLHPMADGNGRVQRMLFQLILFKYKFLPRVNVPVSVIMLRDRSGYEVLQQGHVDQIMAGLAHRSTIVEGEVEESFQHVGVNETIMAAYMYQDFTFAVSCMIKLMQNTLPIIAAKAYFLRRFDWRVDELLKNDALLPPKAATKIAKAFRNDPTGQGLSYSKLLRLLFLDGWWIGFRRIAHFVRIAKHPDDALSLRYLQERVRSAISRSKRRYWLTSSGQMSAHLQITDDARLAGGRVRWVAVSLGRWDISKIAVTRALQVSEEGDRVIAVNYPMVMHELITDGVFPELRNDLLNEIASLRKQMADATQGVIDAHKKEGVSFHALVGDGGSHAHKPASALCNDLKNAELKPFRIYVGYDRKPRHHKFTDFIVQNAPCNVAIIKGVPQGGGKTRWVGLSGRNLVASVAALRDAFAQSRPGDMVVAVHYPTNPFMEEGLSSLHEAHFTSVCDANLGILMDSMHTRLLDTAFQVAEECGKDGVVFKTHVGEETLEPHVALVRDADTGFEYSGIPPPSTIYVGYNQRRDRSRLVGPNKLHDVAEYIVHRSPCNVVLVKDFSSNGGARRIVSVTEF